MYKTLTVAALLLAAFAFTSGSRSADASPTTPIGPAIVAHGKLLNQTTVIPTTTIFTPVQSGLYRLTVYGTITQPDPASSSDWYYSAGWTDDGAGNGVTLLLWAIDAYTGQFAWNQNLGTGGATLTFEAKAGTPVTYIVNQSGPPDNSAYSLYWTLERLE